MHKLKVLFATIVGIVLFIVDFNTGFIGLTLGFPSIFLIVFIAGIIAGDGVSGFVAGFLTEMLGVLLVALVPHVLVPGYVFAADDIFTRIIVVMMISVAYGTPWATDPVPWIAGLFLIIILFIIAPIFFGMALLMGPLGGLIGKAIYARVLKPEEERVVTQPAPTPQPSTLPEDAPEQEYVPEAEGEPLETEEEEEESLPPPDFGDNE
jgi:hypothetical protein